MEMTGMKQMDVVGRAAAAAGLGDQQSHLMQVVLAAFHRVDELADDQQGGITGVVMDVFEALVHDAPMIGGEHLHPEAFGLQDAGHQAKVYGQHGGEEQGIFPLHLLREQEAPVLVVY